MASTTITPGVFADIKSQADNTNHIRKTLEIVAFIAPITADVPSTLIGADGTITVPAGYEPVGTIDPKGVVIDGKVEKDTISSLGYGSPTRTDLMGVAKTIKLTAQERYKAHLESVIAMQDLTKIAPGAGGEIVWDEVSIPVSLEYRLLLITRDVNKATGNDILDGRIYTRVSLSDLPADNMVEKGANDVDLTFDVLEDSEVGTPCRHVLGGKGLADMMGTLGWATAA